MVFLFRRGFGALLNLITQLVTAAIWIMLLAGVVKTLLEAVQEGHRDRSDYFTFGFGLLIVMGLWMLAGALGTLFWFVRQFQHAGANERFRNWLKANAEKIRDNEILFYRCKRITLKTVLVRHHLVCSAVFLTARMTTRWLVKGQEPRERHAWAASLYTFWNGWWGFPLGLIWTPVAIFKNIGGTSTLLVEDLLRVPPPPPPGFKQRMAVEMKQVTRDLLFTD